jgi:hypothetical protein
MTGIPKVTNKFNAFFINLLGGVTVEDKDKEVSVEVRKAYDSCEVFAIEHMTAKCGDMLLTKAENYDWKGEVLVAVSNSYMENCTTSGVIVAPWVTGTYLTGMKYKVETNKEYQAG